MTDFEIAVVGGGPAGSAAALALARAGLKTALIAPGEAPDDGRTAALLQGSVGFLDRLGVWPRLAPQAEALRVMEIADVTGRLFRAPTARFDAAEIGLDAFGYNAANAAIVAALASAAETEPNLSRIEGTVSRAEVEQDGVVLSVGDERVTAHIAIAADGRRSSLRRAAGIEADEWKYPQTALVLNLSHTRPHEGVSTELHSTNGPFTLVPLSGNSSSLVWVDSPERIARLAEDDDLTLAEAIEEKAQGIRGRMTVTSRRWLYPLTGMIARRLAAGPVALVGEAGHALPPIAAQGLNLGLRDVETLVETLRTSNGDFDGALVAYDRQRRADVFGRTTAVHLLNRSLLGSLLPLQIGRAAGLGLLRAAPPLRRALMRAGVQP